ncbi:D-amino acid dehydrogenase [Robbsia sp. KACC 23696]|uniref:D-amino acid dehydrogenase n=1 Tax=Robbsia sp. KACC 23696 TaxID=3149231 RepID=UPI00325B3BE5
MHVCVLGGGVIGITTAYFLARDGHRVTVVDARPEVAHGTSFANGGQLSYSYVAPLASPSVWRYLPAWLASRRAPLLFRPKIDRALLEWSASFLRHCTTAHSEQTTVSLLQLGAYSQSLMATLQERENLAFDFRHSGKLVLYRDADAFAAARKQMAFQKAHGTTQEAWDAAECVRHEPALARLQSVLAGGIYTPTEDAGDCQRFTESLATVLRQRSDVRLLMGCKIEGVNTERGRVTSVETSEGPLQADAFVCAMGAESAGLLRRVGLSLPVYPLKGYSLTVPIDSRHNAPEYSVTDLHHKIVYARLGSDLRIAGMVDFSRNDPAADARRIALLKQQAIATLPDAGDYTRVREWTGYRPATPHGRPLLGATRYANLWLNVGQGALGFTFACASAKIVADQIVGRNPAIDVEPFAWRGMASAGARQTQNTVS